MKRSKNFFYRINPNEVLGEAIFQEDKEQWFMQFFHDLRNDDPLSAKTDLAKEIIEEAHSFRAKRSRAGKASAEQRLIKDEQEGTYVEHMLNDVEQEGTYVEHMLEDVGMCCNTSQPVAVAVAVAETKELKDSCPEQDSELEFLLKDGSLYNIPLNKISEWESLYDSIDVETELKKLIEWCVNNPKKRKTRDGANRFICGWLNREDEKCRIKYAGRDNLLEQEIYRVMHGNS